MMRKCNLSYRLKNDEAGITLVELLAAISLLSIVIMLIGSIHLFAQKQFISQTDSANQANDFSYAMTVMATELRVLAPTSVTVNNEGTSISVNDEATFYQTGTQLLHKGTVLADDIGSFKARKDSDSIEVIITKENQTASNKKYHTKIYFRGESNEAEG